VRRARAVGDPGRCRCRSRDYPDAAFDYAILSQTLQTTKRPDRVLEELLRIGRKAFVSFPNFAHWRVRLSLLWGGRMPVTRLLPVAWYETPNIHHVTVDDFATWLPSAASGSSGAWFLRGDRRRARRRRTSAPSTRFSCYRADVHGPFSRLALCAADAPPPFPPPRRAAACRFRRPRKS
jgi:hypothetical protein